MGSPQTITLLGSSMIKAPANGYVYIYVSNESRNPLYIDNFQVLHQPGRIVEETHYYPFGLVMSGISSRAAGGLENKKKWNAGSELESKEFSDGSGVELYSTFYRSLDPQLGRFWQLDPKPNESESPYASMGNNPISNVDPKGDYFFGLFGSTRGQRKSARSIAEETGGDVKNITSKNVSVKFTFKAGEGSLNYGVAETKFSKNGAPTILGKGVKEIYDGVKNGWGRINPQSNKFERIQASGRVEMVDDPISMLGPAFIRGLIAKVTTSIASVASESVVTEANTSLSITRLSREGELFFRYESSNTAFSRVTSTGGVTPGTYAAPLSDGLVPIESRAATYNLPDPDILRTNVSVLTPPKGTVIIGPKPVAGGTGNEVIFPFGF
ncbi:MAG: hypothetical protein JST95_01690 [Bacteroidetes bacterium]|nr:hypothetical protein [Bacteroidota bacterium]